MKEDGSKIRPLSFPAPSDFSDRWLPERVLGMSFHPAAAPGKQRDMPAHGEAGNRVLIAGGGIGGLAAALGLAQKGYWVLVLEKASALGEIGAGIQLGPNAFHAFDHLGVGEAARGMAVYID